MFMSFSSLTLTQWTAALIKIGPASLIVAEDVSAAMPLAY
jgi:hypothetical protein